MMGETRATRSDDALIDLSERADIKRRKPKQDQEKQVLRRLGMSLKKMRRQTRKKVENR